MNEQKFWEIIERVHEKSNGNMDSKCDLLKEELTTLSDDDLKEFTKLFDIKNYDAYSWDIWGAAYILNGGCSDDSFTDFRTTLISMGKEIYSNALKDPNTLANIKFDDNDPCYEGFQYAINDVLEERFGDIPKSEIPFPDEPSGKEWDEDDVEELFPALKIIDEDISSGQSSSNLSEKQAKPWWKFW